jgi:hypothetical protein
MEIGADFSTRGKESLFLWENMVSAFFHSFPYFYYYDDK